ncbi:hypothetical protein NQ314_013789 [Rhamnusium bicolor]|uniref:Uncharacterized protein n=1 Tax=Rhamnusium bicolor TaxID=1586634 RepID=A0AAV8X5R1_9CUCU|nr:hypothetical protein NQ314_013789 [Rhamnusium bicolor]
MIFMKGDPLPKKTDFDHVLLKLSKALTIMQPPRKFILAQIGIGIGDTKGYKNTKRFSIVDQKDNTCRYLHEGYRSIIRWVTSTPEVFISTILLSVSLYFFL